MDDYWKEVENITRSGVAAGRGEGGGEGEVQEEEQHKIPEGRYTVGRIDLKRRYFSKHMLLYMDMDIFFVDLEPSA